MIASSTEIGAFTFCLLIFAFCLLPFCLLIFQAVCSELV